MSDWGKRLIAAHLRAKGIKTIEALKSDGKYGLPEVLEAFGKWSNARRMVWNIPEYDEPYLIRMVLVYELFTRRRYQEFRNKNPFLCPSFSELLRIAGCSWKKFKVRVANNDPVALLVPLFNVTDINGGKLNRWIFGKKGVPKITVYRRHYTFKELKEMVAMRNKYRGRHGQG